MNNSQSATPEQMILSSPDLEANLETNMHTSWTLLEAPTSPQAPARGPGKGSLAECTGSLSSLNACFFKNLLFGVELISNVVLVSGVQQSE